MGFMHNMMRRFGMSITPDDIGPREDRTMFMGLHGLRALTGDDDTYNNLFSRVNAIATKFGTVQPYAADAHGVPLTPIPPAMQALYHPNDMFAQRDFFSYICSVLLTQPHLDLLIWTGNPSNPQPGGKVTPENIRGYTVLPQDSRQYDASRYDYYHAVELTVNGVAKTMRFTRDETIALNYARHPGDMSREISPSMTVRKWADVDDLISDYERGFFGNHGIPAGAMKIVAGDDSDYEKTVGQLRRAFTGARNVNKLVYSRTPIDPETGKPSQVGKIEFVPYQQVNNTLDIDTLDKVVGDRLSNAIPVPDIIRGLDTGQTYANAEQSVKAFYENTLDPLLAHVWGQFQFELDRITGGLGYQIVYDLDTPGNTDADKTRSETMSANVASLINLVNAGAAVTDAATAMGLDENWAKLTLHPESTPIAPAENMTSNKLTSDVTAEEENKEPDSPAYRKAKRVAKNVLSLIIEAQGISRNAAGDDVRHQISVVMAGELDDAYSFDLLAYANDNKDALLDQLQELAKTDKRLRQLLDDIPADDWDELPDKYADQYAQRLDKVASGYVDGAWQHVADLKSEAQANDWDDQQLVQSLTDYRNSDKPMLLAQNELMAAQRLGALYSAMRMGNAYGVKIRKVWNATGAHPCDLCAELDGTTVDADQAYMDEGESIQANGTTYVNDFMAMQTSMAHPRCQCTSTYEVADD